jgi:hypothetical protein
MVLKVRPHATKPFSTKTSKGAKERESERERKRVRQKENETERET